MSTQNLQAEFFKSSRAKTIGIALVGVLALGGVGVLAGALVDAKVLPLEGQQIGVDTSGAPKPGSGPRGQVEASPAPSPIVSETPSGAPSPSPAATPDADTTTEPTAVLAGGAVAVPLPAPWQGEVAPDGSTGSWFSGEGDWVWAQVALVDPAQNDAANLLALNLEGLLPAEYYSQLEVGEITSQAPFGTLLSVANVPYRALWVDPQSSFPVFGNVWVALRQDGQVLVMSAESTPYERFDVQLWRPLIDGGFTSFAFPQG
jgi:hypothetical protein